MTWLDDLYADLRRDEGRKYKAYDDATGQPVKAPKGNLTIGDGINLDEGLDDAECDFLTQYRVKNVMADMDREIPWWTSRPDMVKRGLVNMAHNLGMPRLAGFSRMLSALHAGDYETAANEALRSSWAVQVGLRATRVANLFRTAANVKVA